MPFTKTMWRRTLLDARTALPAPVRTRHSTAIGERVRALPVFAAAPVLLAYEPFGAEVDPTSLCSVAGDAGSTVYVPTRPWSGGWTLWQSATSRKEQPATLSVADLARVSQLGPPMVALVPAVGFDQSATRLGRGGGFYDRALAELRRATSIVAIGLAFEVQIVDRLPRDPWDEDVDLVATEDRLIACRRRDIARAQRGIEEVPD